MTSLFGGKVPGQGPHAIVARRNGIDVEGITLWLFGGVTQFRSEPRTPGPDFRIAVVGPLTSGAVACCPRCRPSRIVSGLVAKPGLSCVNQAEPSTPPTSVDNIRGALAAFGNFVSEISHC
jgi:hypothetical protein